MLLLGAVLVSGAHAARRVDGALLYDGVAASEASRVVRIQALRAARAARLLGWAADGQLLIATRSAEGEQLERLRAPGIVAAAISHAGAMLEAVATPPFHGEHLAYLAGDAVHDGAALYVQGSSGADERLIMPATARPGGPVFAHDGQHLAFTGNAGATSRAVFIADTAGLGLRQLWTGAARTLQVLGWTHSDHALLVRRNVDGENDELLLIELDTGAARRVDDSAARPTAAGHITEAQLAADDRGVYLIAADGASFARLRYADLFGAPARELAPVTGHELEHLAVSADGRVACSWNENGYTRVGVLDPSGTRLTPVQGLPVGVVQSLQFSPTGARLAIDVAASTAAREVYVQDLQDNTLVRWSRGELGALGGGAPIAAQTVHFPTWDRVDGRARQLAALLLRPREAGPHGVLVVLPGRGRQARPQFDGWLQYCVRELNLVVIEPDLRGASGYGREFAALDGVIAESSGAALDLGALLAWIGVQPDMRRERVALLGRRDGGSLALMALGLYGERLRTAIAIDAPAPAVPLTAIRQRVLLVRGLEEPALDTPAAEQLLWRLRSAGVDTGLVAPAAIDGTLRSGELSAAAEASMAQFLASTLAH